MTAWFLSARLTLHPCIYGVGKDSLGFANNLRLAHGAQAKMPPPHKSIEVEMSFWPYVSSS